MVVSDLAIVINLVQIAIFYPVLRWVIGFFPPLDLWGENAPALQALGEVSFPVYSLGPFSLSGAQLLCLLCGTVLFCVGKAIMRTARRILHPVVRHGGDNPVYLIMEGPYAKRRHPIYAGLVLACIGISITLHSAYALLWAALSVSLRIVFGFYEERNLSRQFGDEYTDYLSRVRQRFFPWWLWLLIATIYAAAWMGLAPLPV